MVQDVIQELHADVACEDETQPSTAQSRPCRAVNVERVLHAIHELYGLRYIAA
jgi:hypothetical protein